MYGLGFWASGAGCAVEGALELIGACAAQTGMAIARAASAAPPSKYFISRPPRYATRSKSPLGDRRHPTCRSPKKRLISYFVHRPWVRGADPTDWPAWAAAANSPSGAGPRTSPPLPRVDVGGSRRSCQRHQVAKKRRKRPVYVFPSRSKVDRASSSAKIGRVTTLNARIGNA